MWKQIFKNKKHPARRIALTYVIIGALWIIFSDRAILMLGLDPLQITMNQTYKGWFFVLGSGLLIFSLMTKAVNDLQKIESTLKEKEIMQKDFLERYYQPLWQTDITGRCTFSNSKWFEFTRFTLGREKVFPWIEIVHDDDKPHCITRFSEGLINKKPFSIEYRLLNANGNYHWVLNSCIPNFSAQGEFQGVTSFLFDINDKKVLDERYRESSKKYGYLFRNNPYPMLVYDRQDFRILEVNNAAMHQYGYDEKEFLSLSLTELHPSSETSRFMNYLSVNQEEYHRSEGWKHIRKDKSMFDAEIITHLLPSNSSRSNCLVMVHDISDKVEAFSAVKEKEERFRKLFENSSTGEIILSDTLKILDINKAGYEMLGVRPEAIASFTPYQFISEESKQTFNEAFQQLEKGIPSNGHANLVHSSGRVFRCEWYGVSFNEVGNTRYFFSFRDIDESFKTQQKLIESQRLNSTLISGLPGMAYRCLNDNKWTMLFVSSGVKKLTGYNVDELSGSNSISYNDIIHPEDREKNFTIVNQSVQSKDPFELVYRIITKDNSIKWVWEKGSCVFDHHDKPMYIEGFIMDITNEKNARQQVEFQSYFLSLIIDNIPFPMFYKGLDGKYLGFNKPFAEYIGKPKEEIIGKTAFEIFDKKQAEIFYQKDLELYNSGQGQIYETEIAYPTGKKLNVVFHKSVFFDMDQKPFGIIGVYFDITERVKAEQIIKRQLEEMARINSELERFTYTVSHDLRSPLVTIKGFLGLLKEDLEEQNHEQVMDDLKRIDDATGKMHQLLEGLMELSRLGRVVHNFEQIHLSQVAHEAMELLFGVIKDRNIQIIIQPDMPKVEGDKSLIREVFQNLLENAIKYTSGVPEPRVKIYARESKDYRHIVCVEDNGIGINPIYHDKIFGLFNKLSATTPGTGVGLSLVKKIIETHNGRIWVESEGENKGSVFCFTLNTEKSQH
jgi:PAS domain S-box-containing protein